MNAPPPFAQDAFSTGATEPQTLPQVHFDGNALAWDDKEELLDELLLAIFTPQDATASVPTSFTDSDGLFEDTDVDTAPDSVYASPASSRYNYDSSDGSASSQSSQFPAASTNAHSGRNSSKHPAFSPMKTASEYGSHGLSTPGSPTASSSDESGAWMGSTSGSSEYGGGGSHADLEMNASGSPVSSKEKRQLEMRRKRNRESMRRVRQRKRIEYSELKKLLPGLEARLKHLRELKAQQQQQLASGATIAVVQSGYGHTGAHGTGLSHAMKQLRIVEDAFRRENAWIEQEIDKYEQAFIALHDTIDELRQADALTEAPLETDPFAWTARAIAFLPQFHQKEMVEFVRHSVIEVVRQVEAATKLRENENEILGWRTRRTVAGPWIHFVFSKDFMHEDVELVGMKTWFVMSQSHTVNSTMPQNHNMKVLRVVNDNTIICARNLFFPGGDTNYCMIYLLMRVKTAKGYVIAQRSLLPENYDELKEHLGPKYSYANVFYALILEHHMIVNTDGNTVPAPTGCKATFGGLAGNGTEIYANTYAKDIFMAMLRWEMACVGPLYRLL